MNMADVILALADNVYMYAFSVIIALLIAVFINYKFIKNFFSGLILVQFSFVFNAAIVIFGFILSKIDMSRVIHYFFFELLTVIGVYVVYKKIINKRSYIITRLKQSNPLIISLVLIFFNMALTIMYVKSVATDGSSRIEFMVSGWFSYVRPFISLMVPLSYLFSIFLLDKGNKMLGVAVIGSSIFSNIASGSKASFILGILSAFLIYRDLSGGVFLLSRLMRVAIIGGVTILALLSLAKLNVGLADVGERIILTGDATIMVYFSEHPDAASVGLSTLAKVHRGAARLLGDSSATNNDTLFGFALNMQETGENSFTGPNASIPAYMLCNYRGIMNLIGIASILGYLLILVFFVNNVVLNFRINNSILLLPFVLSSLGNFSQDYYSGMSDIVLIMGLAAIFGLAQMIAPLGSRS